MPTSVVNGWNEEDDIVFDEHDFQDEGREAFSCGMKLSDNPHECDFEAHHWRRGWLDAEMDEARDTAHQAGWRAFEAGLPRIAPNLGPLTIRQEWMKGWSAGRAAV